MAVNDVERQKAIALANYIHCSVHEWPTGDDVPLLCYALLHEVNQTGELRAQLAAANERAQVMCKPPSHCPVTGRPFFMILEGEDGEEVATYGGPFDSYTMPEWSAADAEFRSERYDHDAGYWIEGGEPYPFILVDESEQNGFIADLDTATARAEKAEAELKAANERAEKAEVERADALRCSGENAKAWQEAVCDEAVKRTHLLKEIGLTEQQRDALAARVAELEGALECIPVDLINAIENGEKVRIFLSTESCKLIGVALVRTPTQSLAKVQAAAIREAKTALNSNVLGNGDYYAGMEAGIESAKNTLEEMAERLESEAENG